MAKISLCLIARYEEHLLPGALESVYGVVDEIIVVEVGGGKHDQLVTHNGITTTRIVLQQHHKLPKVGSDVLVLDIKRRDDRAGCSSAAGPARCTCTLVPA